METVTVYKKEYEKLRKDAKSNSRKVEVVAVIAFIVGIVFGVLIF